MKNIYKKLIKKLLEHYINKSSQSNNPYRFIVYKNSDNNLTLFEKLSINDQIGLYTNLSDFDSRIIILIFDSLYSKNYFYYKKNFIKDILYDSDINDEEFGLDDMLCNLENNIINIEKWIEYLELIPTKVDFDNELNKLNELENYFDEYGTDIEQLKIYLELPQVSKYYELKHNQKFYSLEELYNI